MHHHEIVVQTDAVAKTVAISPKASGYGSAVNGGELLLLALATCFCNDIYREATRRNLPVAGVEVTVTGEFGAEGESGTNFQYQATVDSTASAAEIDALLKHTDRVAEVQNTLRKGVSITLIT